MTATRIRPNKFAADCARCSSHIASGAGRLVQEDGGWLVFCADSDACEARSEAATAAEVTEAGDREEMVKAEYLRREAAGENPDYWDVAADIDAQLRAARQPSKPAPMKRRASTSRRRRACVTGGNCSSTTGHDCGGHDCDANAN